MRRASLYRLATAASLAAAALPQEAFAYIGPGAGLSVIGTLLALLFAVLLTFIGFLWYPIKRVIGRRRKTRKPQ